MSKLRGLPAQLAKYLSDKKWVPKGDITALEWRHTSGRSIGSRYLPDTVGRTLRHLEEAKIIAVKPCGISVQYRYLPEEWRKDYMPVSCRPKGKEETLFK